MASRAQELKADLDTYWRMVEEDSFPGAGYSLHFIDESWAVIEVSYKSSTAAAFVNVAGVDKSGGDMVGVTFALMNVIRRAERSEGRVVRLISAASDWSFDPEAWMINWARENLPAR